LDDSRALDDGTYWVPWSSNGVTTKGYIPCLEGFGGFGFGFGFRWRRERRGRRQMGGSVVRIPFQSPNGAASVHDDILRVE
jgi:hypothetical protein